MRTRLVYPVCLVLLLAAGGCAAPRGSALPEDPGVYFPLEAGDGWRFGVSVGDAAQELETRAEGGDRRTLPGFGEVDFKFVYGRPDDMDHDLTKSIYAMPPSGPREFYFDAFQFRMKHDPPVALLPERVVPGAEWAWGGTVECGELNGDTFAKLRVVGEEEVIVPAGTFKAVRVRASYASPRLEITRWFAPGVGLIRMDVDGGEEPVRVVLLEHRRSLPR